MFIRVRLIVDLRFALRLNAPRQTITTREVTVSAAPKSSPVHRHPCPKPTREHTTEWLPSATGHTHTQVTDDIVKD